MNKTILTYGLLSGALTSVLMIGTAAYFNASQDTSNGALIGYTGIVLSMLLVYFGVRAYREREASDGWGFGKAFQAGLLITLISCVCYVVSWLLVYEFVMPDFMDKYIEQSLAQMRSSGLGEEQIQQQAAKMEEMREMYKNPFVRAGLTFLEPFPIGLLTTLVSALVLRKK